METPIYFMFIPSPQERSKGHNRSWTRKLGQRAWLVVGDGPAMEMWLSNGSTMVNNGYLLGLMMRIMVNNPTYGGSSHESDS